jgi:O-methyltransferase
MVKRLALKAVHKLGYTVIKNKYMPPPYDDNVERIIAKCEPFTMTSRARLFALYQAVKYLNANNIPGDFVECGVWRGGSSMAAALSLLEIGDRTRHIYMYDTYEGMSEPTEKDVDFRNTKIKDVWNRVTRNDKVMCYATLDDVRENMESTGFPSERLHYIKGKVEDTIPGRIPEQIALLRLDTDWYESTKHEMVHLYPLLAPNGVLILDDYGHWQGARQAVDEYFKAHDLAPLLNAIDYSGRISIKTS